MMIIKKTQKKKIRNWNNLNKGNLKNMKDKNKRNNLKNCRINKINSYNNNKVLLLKKRNRKVYKDLVQHKNKKPLKFKKIKNNKAKIKNRLRLLHKISNI